MNRIVPLILSFFLLAPSLYAQTLSQRISSILNGAKGITRLGIEIVDSDSGEIIFEKNPHVPVIPASNIKLFTTSAALLNLGKNFLFTTDLLTTDQDVSDGVINGDLILKGFANPFFTSRELDSMAIRLKELGIKKISGNIICDDSYFDANYNRTDWIKHERSNVVLPPISSIIVDRNEITVTFIPNKNERKFDFGFSPHCSFYDVKSKIKVTRHNRLPTILVHTKQKAIDINIKGYVRRRRYPYSYKAFVDNPPLFAANLLYDRLEKNGIAIAGKVLSKKYKGKTFRILRNSTTLEDIIKKTDKESDNFLSEIIFKTLGAQYSHEVGNSFYATQAVYSFIEKVGIDDDNLEIVDGSGISRSNRLTAYSITRLLKYIYNNDAIFNTFFSSLSSAGEDGTLEQRLVGFGLKGNFHGKTGTLNGVSAISGYLTTNSGKNVIVSMLINFNRSGADYFRELQDAIIIAVAKYY